MERIVDGEQFYCPYPTETFYNKDSENDEIVENCPYVLADMEIDCENCFREYIKTR